MSHYFSDVVDEKKSKSVLVGSLQPAGREMFTFIGVPVGVYVSDGKEPRQF